MHLRLRPIALAVAALSMAVAVAGCSTERERAAAVATLAPTVFGPSEPSADLSSGTPVDDTAYSGSDEPTSTDDWFSPSDDRPVLTQIWLADEPSGSGPQIALRFLRALQRHDDLAADRELYSWGRFMFSGEDLATLHTVMNDVRRHAQLDAAGLCSRAEPLTTESAVVTCGRTKIVVHVLHDDYAHGVQISHWHVHHDVYRGRHTHAYTTVEF